MKSIELTKENLKKYSAAIVVTDHDDVDYKLISGTIPVIVDTRGVYRKLNITNNVVQA
jgi:UDP-N-acetyl-D-glucosamine dehydrogenase